MNLKTVKGTKDIFGLDSQKYNYITQTAAKLFEAYGYNRMITPIFEETALFKRGIGEGTDIVDKEMYTFETKGGVDVALRPEGTAPIVRSYLQHKIYGKEDFTRWYYYGPMFRYEKPQAGRYREFNQVGAESFGKSDPVLDAEIIAMGYKLLEKLGITDLEVQINSIGGKDTRTKYREALINYLSDKNDNLCKDCKTRVNQNPLRVLDCKDESCRELTKEAPSLIEFLDDAELSHYNKTKEYLELFNVKFVENKNLVRGLDYYSNTVFEIVTNKLGSQGTVLAGGRYDNLVQQMGGKPTPAFGFAAGVERLMLLLDDNKIEDEKTAFIVWMGEEAKKKAFTYAQKLRMAGIKTLLEFEDKSMRAQFKKTDKIKPDYILIIGEDEIKENKVVIKDYKNRTQESYHEDDILVALEGEK